MPSYGNEAIEQTHAQSQDDGSYVSFKDVNKHTVYPAFFLGSADEAPEIVEASGLSVFDFMPAQNFEISLFPDKTILKEYNDALGEDEKHLSVSGKIKFEVDNSFKSLDNLKTMLETDPVAWLLYQYQTDTSVADAVDAKLSGQFATPHKNLKVKTRVLLWMFDENLSNRYVEMSVGQYTAMIDDYKDNNGGNVEQIFLQTHAIKRTGSGAGTGYSLIHVDNAEGVEFDSKLFKPLGSTNQFGIAPENTAERARLVSWLVGEDNLPVNIGWLDDAEEEVATA